MVIRPSQRTDAQSMSRIYVQTWQDTYLSVVPYAYLLSMSVSQHEKAFHDELKSRQITSFVAEESSRVIGFITGGFERHGDEIYSGEVSVQNWFQRWPHSLIVAAFIQCW